MSEENKKLKVKALKPSALVKVDIGYHFYNRLLRVFFWYVNHHDPKEGMEALERLKKDNDPKNEFEYHLVTMIALLYQIEHKAQEQGFLEDRELDLNNPEHGINGSAEG